ncbi:A-kinase anchor protein 8-like isoform X3 [Oncorhynchus mykiss]|uniref:A-kinase anchor protein 8-like isoform X3 n=1 Tax=Oncorhynchus mykiss TaxID=8022 RepID=UPI0018782D67|nr:A-kinase anchor protein 8-like isoform X3 [Oncorhynchus mykiss]
MEGRGYSSGYSSWGGGSGSRGSDNYDPYGGGYKDSMSGMGGYGGGHKRGLSGSSLLSTGTSADAVIAKINQRLDMLTQLEGGMKGGGRSDRFDQYESFDSRGPSSLPSRDLYRSGSYGYGDGRGDMTQRASGFGGGGGLGSGFDSSSSYGAAKMQRQNMRDSFSSGQGGGSWAGAGQRSPRRGGGRGGFGGRRSDPTPMGGGGGRMGGRGGGRGGGGHSPGGRGKLPSLLGHRMPPQTGAFHQSAQQGRVPGHQDFPGRHFGGGPQGGHQRGRKRPLNRQQQQPGGGQRDGQKKRKQTLTAADEPESKMNKTESAGGETAEEPAENNGEENEATKAPADGEKVVSMQEEISQMKKKLQTGKQTPPQDKVPKNRRKRGGFLERSGVTLTPKSQTQRVTFACSVCKFRSFYHEDMAAHLESKFHKDHFKFLSSQLSKPTTDFLQEYLNNKYKKTEQRTSQMENHCAAICQVYKEQDLTRQLGMEHFMKKVEAAHCAACDLFIPMQFYVIQKHLKSPDHNFNRKGMMEQSKRASLSVARSILNHKIIGKKLESYLKGENPFLGNQDDQDPEDSMIMEVSEAELTNESLAETTKEEAGPETSQEATGADGVEEEKMEEGGVAVADAGEEEAQVEKPAGGDGDTQGEEETQGEGEAEGELEQVGEEEEEGFEVGDEFGEEDEGVEGELGEEEEDEGVGGEDEGVAVEKKDEDADVVVIE